MTLDDFIAVLEEAGSGSLRAAALIGTALLEDVLKRVLLSRMIPLNSRRMKKLFGPTAPLGPMEARIRVAHALNLIDDDLKHDLSIVSEIRNKFAHTPEPISFKDVSIAEQCAKLSVLAGMKGGDTRTRYMLAINQCWPAFSPSSDRTRSSDLGVSK